MVLQQKSVLTLAQQASVVFVSNHATTVGGALFVESDTFYSSTDSGAVYIISVCMIEMGREDETTLEFINNSAGNGGDVVYGGNMGLATTADGSNCL